MSTDQSIHCNTKTWQTGSITIGIYERNTLLLEILSNKLVPKMKFVSSKLKKYFYSRHYKECLEPSKTISTFRNYQRERKSVFQALVFKSKEQIKQYMKSHGVSQYFELRWNLLDKLCN